MNTQRPKILMIASTGPSPEHPHQAVFVQRWAQQLADAGCDVRVFTRRHITLGTYISSWSRVREYYMTPRCFQYDWDGIPVNGVQMHMLLPLNFSSSAVRISLNAVREPLKDIYKEFPFDLMYMATWGDFSLAAANVAKSLEVPYIATAIGGYENRYYDKPHSIPYKIQRELYEGSKLVLCVSRDLEQKAQFMTESSVPTCTWDAGVDMQHFKPSEERRRERCAELGIAEDELLLTFVGRLGEQKGIYELLSAFCILKKENQRVKLALVGHAKKKRLIEHKLRIEGLENHVLLVGGVPATQIVGYLNATDLFVFPSWHEGLPNVIKEASACALPIIATNVGGIPEIIKTGENGLLVPPRDPDALLEAMLLLVKDAELRSKFGAAARKRVSLDYDSQRNGGVLVNMIREIICENGRKKENNAHPLSR